MITEGAATPCAEVPAIRRVRRTRSRFERLVRPEDVAPGEPTPSVEGWVLFLTNLPPNTTMDHITDLFVTREGEGLWNVREVKMPLDKNCECCGYALVELEKREAFEAALRDMEGMTLSFAEGEPPNGEDAWRLHIAPTFLGEKDDEEEELVAGGKRERE
ncbi:RNA-binding protein, putative [Trypanosoma equiperdum]|uniref:RRM domain-containing protein n=4 Tax=Trypanozoon TaxID=39700 RepID=Q57WT3_TRYB2|nr:hypothetical protein, conserved [Trypanosoma brucei gambiense DAL972]XP_845741.1 hypothetical protein, conserved [Trypanosoma brucei brucei TREU927]AAX69966.1 hypothetical protein, conserved [Trypanosoma brucei]RHW71224.1 RNA-binding protein [Trypanosoma brucei equiperdum]SCU67230.1 RNA-binding protein, putative [Trypanosoma equiperdum]AAZ12182.1 hypothetical protein, conserved [Trypanosoma brucei brucei TREU927]CBH12139.1 hypothetical protein, conserved [Trypanosoma brucei gambiense DAL97|eukprot:XP_011774422.1 hypothetical protein, conserved [Trypanosoma brucei gambiense DAL972]